MKKLTINSVHCDNKTNISNGNDVFFMVQSDGGPPIRYPVDGTWTMDDNETIPFPHGDDPQKPEFAFEDNCYVSVWDHDGPFNWVNQADMLGNAAFEPGDPVGPRDVDIWGRDSSRYSLNITISDMSVQNADQDTPIPTSLQETLNQELEAWKQTPDGQAVMGTSDMDTLSDKFEDGLKNAFQRTVQAAGEIPWIESVSLGITAQVEVFGGIQGDFGVVMGLDGFPDDWAIYAGGAIVEGFEAGMSAAVNFGLWSQKPEDVGGFYEGVEVEITDVAGVSAAIWVGRGDRDKVLGESGSILNTLKLAKAAFLGVDLGLDDGVSAEELYIIAGHIESYPTFQTGTYKNMAVLTDLVCNDKHSSLGASDDVWLHWKVDGKAQAYQYPIWASFEMDDGDEDHWQCGTIIKFDDHFDLTLYAKSDESTKEMDEDEDDNKARFDLGSFGNAAGGTTTFTFHDGGTEYSLSMKLLEKG